MKNIHILPTDKPSRLVKSKFSDTLLLADMASKRAEWKRFNIYITSDEEIKDGDWFLTDDKRVEKCAPDWRAREWHKKIIITTDQDLIKDGVQAIDDEFLEWFIQNPICEEVEVETVNNKWHNEDGTILSVNVYKIIIPNQEPKEDMLQKLLKSKETT